MFKVNNKDSKVIMSFCSGVDNAETWIPSKNLPVQIQQYIHQNDM